MDLLKNDHKESEGDYPSKSFKSFEKLQNYKNNSTFTLEIIQKGNQFGLNINNYLHNGWKVDYRFSDSKLLSTLNLLCESILKLSQSKKPMKFVKNDEGKNFYGSRLSLKASEF